MAPKFFQSDEPYLEDLLWGDNLPEQVPAHITIKKPRTTPARIDPEHTFSQPVSILSEPLERLVDRHNLDFDTAISQILYARGGKPDVMLKISGSCLTPEMAEDIADLSQLVSLAIVVGGGDEITMRCKQLGIPVNKYGPWRVTTKEVLDVVVDVMTKMAHYFASLIQQYGGKAFPLVGTPAEPLIFADKLKKFPINVEGDEIEPGHFGVIPEKKVDAYIGSKLLDFISQAKRNEVPVVAALGHLYKPQMPSGGYQALNIDGDAAVRLIAHKVNAKEFLLVTPSGGVKLDNGIQELFSPPIVPELSLSEFRRKTRKGLVVDEGMKWKLTAAFRIVQEQKGNVALISPDNVVPYLLDRDRMLTSYRSKVVHEKVPQHINGPYGTTLVLG